MHKKKQLLIAGVGTAAGFYAVRTLAGKRIETLPYGYGIKLKRAVTIDRPAEQLYSYWRDLPSLPRLFSNIVSVQVLDALRSHWM